MYDLESSNVSQGDLNLLSFILVYYLEYYLSLITTILYKLLICKSNRQLPGH